MVQMKAVSELKRPLTSIKEIKCIAIAMNQDGTAFITFLKEGRFFVFRRIR